MDDLISRQAAIDAMEKCIMDCNPDHFVSCSKFIKYMHNADIGSFGQWQFANGFNMGVTASKVAINVLQSEHPEHKRGKWLINKGLYECSSCHQLWAEWWAISKPIERMKKECPYCPMCGSYNGEETDDGGKSEE